MYAGSTFPDERRSILTVEEMRMRFTYALIAEMSR